MSQFQLHFQPLPLPPYIVPSVLLTHTITTEKCISCTHIPAKFSAPITALKSITSIPPYIVSGVLLTHTITTENIFSCIPIPATFSASPPTALYCAQCLLTYNITTENKYFLYRPFQIHSQLLPPYRPNVYYFNTALYCSRCSSDSYYQHRKKVFLVSPIPASFSATPFPP